MQLPPAGATLEVDRRIPGAGTVRLFRVLEMFLAGESSVDALREQVELADARTAALEARLDAAEANLRAAGSRCAQVEAERHFLEIQLMQARQRHDPNRSEAGRRA